MTLPPQSVPKTREALATYEDADNEVPAGIWYEVAIAEYLSELFRGGQGARFVLYAWGSYEDTVLGRDAILLLPGTNKGIPVDFTTDDRRKTNLVLKLDKAWFAGRGRGLEVNPGKTLRSGRITVAYAVRTAFRDWFSVARESIPLVDGP